MLQRLLPFWLASLVDRAKVMLIPLVMLMMPLVRAAPPLLRWRTRRKIYRWYSDLREIDQRLVGGLSDPELDLELARLKGIEHQVAYVDVPLSYMEEFYHLRLHLGMLQERLTRIARAPPGDSESAQALKRPAETSLMTSRKGSRAVLCAKGHSHQRPGSRPVLPDQVEEFRFADDGDRHALADQPLRRQELRALVPRDVVVRAPALDDDVDSTRHLLRNGCSRLSDQHLGIKSSNGKQTGEDDGFPFEALEEAAARGSHALAALEACRAPWQSGFAGRRWPWPRSRAGQLCTGSSPASLALITLSASPRSSMASNWPI